MTNIIRPIGAAAILLSIMSTGAAAQDGEKRPEIYTRLIDCRSVADPAARLACYDAQVAALDQAEKDRQLIIVDRAQVREARRGLFGLTLPRLSIFGDGDRERAEAEEFTSIETTIKSARTDGRGRWNIILEDGARWVQVDSRELSIDPRAGHKIQIRQAALGSFLANVSGQTAIRVRRVN